MQILKLRNVIVGKCCKGEEGSIILLKTVKNNYVFGNL